MSLQIPPVLRMASGAIAGLFLSRSLPVADFEAPGAAWVGAALLLASLMILVRSVASFIRWRTTVDPMRPDKADVLVTDGLYRFSRNPMYLAFAILLAGGAVLLGNGAALIAPAVFVWLVTLLQIKPEERALRQKFGAAYDAYCARTRRWL